MAADTTTFNAPADEAGITTYGAATPAKAKSNRARKLLLLGLGGIVAKVGIGFGVWWWLDGQNYVTTDNAYVGASTAQINSQTSGQILSVVVNDTDAVRKGQMLATIDPADAKLAAQKAEADYHRAIQRVQQYFAQESASQAQ